ncbi:hypothetical protein G3T36_18450 [Diaminobutyricibacter tongyongensis]|uniref:Uncharacterized protein n=1 Tax=Leifsonia tongyongensis TaxID=1268043 RepID=A0A6L9Y2D8_9MICO|nr:hypothetical protein [Diaminobutyricibacter tongyongensis]NEN07841.1 hypothetical protein [Diaminobutyricibacter tongyongensis]
MANQQGWNEPVTYRTRKEAEELAVQARAVVNEVTMRLPPGQFELSVETLFVGRQIPEEVAVFLASVVGVDRSLTAVEFELTFSSEENVDWIIEGLVRYRDKLLAAGE